MKEQDIRRAINDLFTNEGIPIYGVATAKKLSSLPESFSPRALLKGAESVICYGVQIPKGLLSAENSILDLYWRHCSTQYRVLDSVSNRLCSYLEERNCSATPVYSCFPWKVVNREFWGYLPLVYWLRKLG